MLGQNHRCPAALPMVAAMIFSDGPGRSQFAESPSKNRLLLLSIVDVEQQQQRVYPFFCSQFAIWDIVIGVMQRSRRGYRRSPDLCRQVANITVRDEQRVRCRLLANPRRPTDLTCHHVIRP